jgi:hypothetical protein
MLSQPSAVTPFLSEAEAARFLGVHPSTLLPQARAGAAPIEPVWVTPNLRRYPRAELERLAGIRAERAA